jgi:SAM-dependent methyltransferase
MVCFYASRAVSASLPSADRETLARDFAAIERCRPTLDHFHHGAATARSQCGQIRRVQAIVDGVTDPYLDGLYRWWHLTGPSPELLVAEADGWLQAATAGAGAAAAPTRTALDVGCGLGSEVAYLSGTGWCAVGIDLSWAAVSTARELHRAGSEGAMFARADVLRLPFAAGSFALAIDRGCLHYLAPERWPQYAAELHRVLRPAGRLLLRACLTSAGVRNSVTGSRLLAAFAGWTCHGVREVRLVSDMREMPALVVRLQRTADRPRGGA